MQKDPSEFRKVTLHLTRTDMQSFTHRLNLKEGATLSQEGRNMSERSFHGLSCPGH